MNQASPQNLFESVERHVKDMEEYASLEPEVFKNDICDSLLELCAKYI